ncbi:molybdate ABC transporter substrate-binding protein [Cupriavidus sp. 8B]
MAMQPTRPAKKDPGGNQSQSDAQHGFLVKPIIYVEEQTMIKGAFAALRLAALIFLVHAASAIGTEIKVLSTPTLKTSLEELGPQFERASGHTLVFKFDGVAPLKRQIEAGETFDIAILLPPMIDDLTKQGKIAAGTRTNIAQAAVGVAIRAGAPKPDISTVDAFKQTLLKARSMSYSSDSASGTYFAALFDRLGIGAEAKIRLKSYAGSGVMTAVAKGDAELTVITVPNIIGTPGVELAGLLPPELQNYTVFTAGEASNAPASQAAKAFINFLVGPEATSVLKAKGLQRTTP